MFKTGLMQGAKDPFLNPYVMLNILGLFGGWIKNSTFSPCIQFWFCHVLATYSEANYLTSVPQCLQNGHNNIPSSQGCYEDGNNI